MNMLKQLLPYIVAVVILALLYALWGYPLLRKKNEAENILEEKQRALKQIYSSSLGPPSDKLIAAMEKDNMELMNKYIKLRKKLPIAEELSPPEGVSLPLFFLEELKNTKEKLRSKAREKGVEILTEDLGLSNVLPSNEDAPQLIENLYITKMVVDLLIEEVGVISISHIKVGGTEELGGTRKTDMYEEVPLSLTVNCDMLSLTKLLFTLENTDKGFFVVKDFSFLSNIESTRTEDRRDEMITSGGMETKEEIIQANLELSVIKWKGL